MTRKYKHTRFAGLVYLNQMPGLWRFVDVHDGMPKEGEAPHVVGPQYKTERELLADADRYARESWGYGKADAPTGPTKDEALRSLIVAFKDIVGSAENGKPYTLEELTGPSFRAAQEAVATYDPDRAAN